MSVIVMFIAKVQVSPIDVVHQLTIKRQMAASHASATESEKKGHSVEEQEQGIFNDTITEGEMQETINSMKPAFSYFDLNNDSFINSEELRTQLRSHNVSDVEAEVQETMEHADLDGNGNVTFTEFVSSFINGTEENTDPGDTFAYLDINKDGGIDAREFNKAHVVFGMSESEAGELMKEYDYNNDSKITFDEYLEHLDYLEWVHLDKNKDGDIDGKEFRKGHVGKYGTSESEARELMKETDNDDDGKISFDEYREYLDKLNLVDYMEQQDWPTESMVTAYPLIESGGFRKAERTNGIYDYSVSPH